jgi:hypothetical protein
MSMVTYSDGHEAALGDVVQGKSGCSISDGNVDSAGSYRPRSSDVWKLEGWSANACSSCREKGKPGSFLKGAFDFESINEVCNIVCWVRGILVVVVNAHLTFCSCKIEA